MKMKTNISIRPNVPYSLELGGPREDEDGLDVEDDEEQGEHVVADLALRPPIAHRVDAALVRDRLLRARPVWPKQAAEPEQDRHEQHGSRDEDGHGEVAPEELGHRGGTLHASLAAPESERPSGEGLRSTCACSSDAGCVGWDACAASRSRPASGSAASHSREPSERQARRVGAPARGRA